MEYRGQHSLTFESVNEASSNTSINTRYNTWDDFRLIPTSRPVFNLPEVKSEYIDIPQRDGSIDLTTRLGYANLPRYGMRKGTWEFWVPPFLSKWPMDFQRLANAVHGLTKRIYSADDPYYYYEGRLTVDEWQNGNDGNGNNVTIGYTLQPFKTAIYTLGGDRQKWDPFCFATDYFISDGRTNTGPANAVSINAGETVDFLLPSPVLHTSSHTADAYPYESDYPYLENTEHLYDDLFRGFVQTPFELYVNPLRSNGSHTITVRLYNQDFGETEKSYVFTPWKKPSVTGGVTIKHDDFIISQRDLKNKIRISITSTHKCDVTLITYLRSL